MNFPIGEFPEEIVNEGFDGCMKECREDEVLVVDPYHGDWECVPIVVDAEILNGVCPGKFQTGIILNKLKSIILNSFNQSVVVRTALLEIVNAMDS